MSTTQIALNSETLPLDPLLVSRQAFLMCAPDLYEVDYVINPWMVGQVHHASRERAAAQWKDLYRAVSEIADVTLIAPQPGSPDMVFTANAGLVYRRNVALSRFFHPERQGEEPHFRRWFESAGYTILDIPRSTPFEGEGDALFSTDGSRLWAGFGPRTLAASHQFLRDAWKIDVVPLHLVDPRFYHLDTCFAPLSGGFLLYFPQAFDAASRARIEDFYPAETRIIVEPADAARFACNVVNIDRTLILNRISPALSTQLKALGFEVIPIELSEFMKAGGAAKCLVMKLPKLAL
ncbi:MAG TPA: arginine deiminase-related protein [Granulicella sp.]|jgi:N-dimethylarginine dimethylaminohydrolase|nr:arginine deiminase-related protein [Granulicella sp.]